MAFTTRLKRSSAQDNEKSCDRDHFQFKNEYYSELQEIHARRNSQKVVLIQWYLDEKGDSPCRVLEITLNYIRNAPCFCHQMSNDKLLILHPSILTIFVQQGFLIHLKVPRKNMNYSVR